MSANQEKILAFLRANGVGEFLIGLVRENTAPLYGIAESRHYPLLPADEIDGDRLMAAVRAATRREVARVEFVSIDNPFAGFGWMPATVIEGNLLAGLREALHRSFSISLDASPWSNLWGDSLTASLNTGLWDSLRTTLGTGVRDRLGTILRKDLDDRLGACLDYGSTDGLGIRPWDTLRDSHGIGIRTSLGEHLAANLGVLIFYFHGFVLSGDMDMIERLLPLVRQLPESVPPLGFKKDEPTVLLVPTV